MLYAPRDAKRRCELEIDWFGVNVHVVLFSANHGCRVRTLKPLDSIRILLASLDKSGSYIVGLLDVMVMWVLMAFMRRYLLPVIDNDMCDLIEFFWRPLRKMIPGTRLPVIDRPGRQDPGRQIQEQVIRQGINKRFIRPSYLIKTPLRILFVLQL